MVRGSVYSERAETATVSCGTGHVNNQTVLKVHHFGGYSNKGSRRDQNDKRS